MKRIKVDRRSMDKHQACSRVVSALCCLSAVLLFSLLAASPRPAAAQTVVVMVNGDPITSRDIDQRAKFNQLVTHKAPAREDVIEELINEKLKIQVGRRYKLEIGDRDVDASYAEMGKRMNLSPEQLSQTLEKAGVDPGTLKSRIRADMVWQNIVRGKFQSSFQFRDKDILAALETRKKDDKDKEATEKVSAQEYLLRPILFIVPKGSPQSRVDARRTEAEALRSRFQDCERGLPFARALKDVAVRDQITRSSADLAPALRDILERTGVGRLTSPETTPNGVELFAICDKREVKADAPALRQVRQEMINEQFEAKSKRFLSELRRQALIEKK
jgi:peptidyl-prolyl cis-trans isomerase SurA